MGECFVVVGRGFALLGEVLHPRREGGQRAFGAGVCSAPLRSGSLEAEGAKPRQGVQNLDQPPRSAVSIAGCSCGMLREHRPRAAAALSGPKGDMSSVT